MGFREKLVWAQIVPLTGLLAYLCWCVWGTSVTAALPLSRAAILFAALQLLTSAYIYVFSVREPSDERDRSFESGAYKTAYLLLFWGGIIWVSISLHGQEPSSTLQVAATGLLGLLLIAEVVRWAVLLVRYRIAATALPHA